MTTVQDTVLDAAGAPVSAAAVRIVLIAGPAGQVGYTSGGTVIAPVSTLADNLGKWSANLTPNTAITPASTYYLVYEGANTVPSAIVVPAAGGPYNVPQILAAPPPTPAATAIAASIVTAKGDLLVGTGAGSVTRQGVGADGQVLTADSAQAGGIRWATGSGGGVPTARLIGTTAPLAGGGDLSADRTLSVADATAGGKGVVSLAGDLGGTAAAPTVPGLAGKVGTARQVISGTGLTGGGDLNADRTLAVSYGTASGTAAQGNDSRFTDAVVRQTVTTKGDLIVATASATVTRVGVGADGTALVADATQATGAKWALTATDAARSLYAAGFYYNPWSPDGSGTSLTLGDGTLRLAPTIFPAGVLITRIGAEVTTGGSAGALFRPMVFQDDGTGYPGALLLDGGALDVTTTGFKEAIVSVTLFGLVWIGGAVQGSPATQPTMRTGFERPVVPIRAGTSMNSANSYGYSQSAVSGAAPANFTTTRTTSGVIPRIFIKT